MSEKTIIDHHRAIALLEEAVQLRGEDYVYDQHVTGRCVYVKDGQPSCGVGVALALGGADLDRVAALDGPRVGIGAFGLPRRELGPIAVTPEAAEVFATFQDRQDRLETWGMSLHYAREAYNDLLGVVPSDEMTDPWNTDRPEPVVPTDSMVAEDIT